jgi:hypothetical protein
MQGLLDFIKTPEGQGLLSAAFGGMAGAQRGTPWNNVGRAGVAGLMGYGGAQDRQTEEKKNAEASAFRSLQSNKLTQEMQAAQAAQDARNAYKNNLPEEQRSLFDIAPDKFVENLPQFQKPTLVEVADPNDPLRTVKKWMKPGASDGTIAGYGALPEILDPRVQEAKTRISKAGASNINVTPKIEVKTGESIAGQIGPILKGTRDQAVAGIKLVDSSSRVLEAAESGKVYSGPGATIRMRGAQIADSLGIAGKSTAEKIANTRKIIRGMAEQGVAARSQLGGQAQISNAEQELLNRATAGDIDDLTTAEIVQLAELNDRMGREMYTGHQTYLDQMAQNPNLSGMAGFYKVAPIPAARKKKDAQQPGGWSITPVK